LLLVFHKGNQSSLTTGWWTQPFKESNCVNYVNSSL